MYCVALVFLVKPEIKKKCKTIAFDVQTVCIIFKSVFCTFYLKCKRLYESRRLDLGGKTSMLVFPKYKTPYIVYTRCSTHTQTCRTDARARAHHSAGRMNINANAHTHDHPDTVFPHLRRREHRKKSILLLHVWHCKHGGFGSLQHNDLTRTLKLNFSPLNCG